MEELRDRIDELAALMREFHLSEARLEGDEWKVSFRRGRRRAESEHADQPLLPHFEAPVAAPPAAPEGPKGTPVSSPMNGIYYATPSPNTPPFVREGDTVSSGQVVGLIEAMKVFNEITAPTSGTVGKILVESGQLVQPGEPLLYIE